MLRPFLSHNLRRTSAALFAAAAGAAASASVSEVVLQIEATSASGGGSLSFALHGGSWDGATDTYTWRQMSPLSILDSSSGQVVATLRSADVYLKRCSEIDVNLSVDAGDSTTTFVVRSPQMSFVSIPTGTSQAKTFARFELTDLNNNGATFTGLGTPGTGAFRAHFNGTHPSTSEFSHLVAYIACSAGGTGYGQQNDPVSGYRQMNTDVTDMSVYLGFVVSAGDRCYATTRYDVNPDPSNCPEDADGDGSPDWLDGCPNDAAKIAPGGCGCGVADADDDGDGVLNCNDNCASMANADQADGDQDGAGDACDPPSPPDDGEDGNDGDDSDDGEEGDDGDDGNDDGSQDDDSNDSDPDDAPNPDDGDDGSDVPSTDGHGDGGADQPAQNPGIDTNGSGGLVAGAVDESDSPSGPGSVDPFPYSNSEDEELSEELADAAVTSMFGGCGASGLTLAPLGVLGALGLKLRRRR